VDFWPDPLDTTTIAASNSTNTAVYNKLWKVDCDDINAFVTAYNGGSVTAGSYTVPADILAYPAKGIANFQKNLEPFVDANNNGLYDPQSEGDYPIIKGQQQILSIFNDNYSVHGETHQAPAMGLEIHERSYAYFQPTINDSMEAINYSTFYHYTIFNRSDTNYNHVLISDWSDVDLGYYLDDYIGTDTVNKFAYCYNGKNFDTTALGVIGYGNKPPVVSHAIIKTDCSHDGIDNNADGTIDEAGETFILNRTSFYNNTVAMFPAPTTNPNNALDYYDFMNDVWKDASPFTFGGTAYGGATPTHFVYPGDPQTNSGWTEGTAGNPYGDRRVFITSGPFNLPAHSKIEWGYAIVFSQDTSQAVNTITQFHKRVQRDVRNAIYYDQSHQAPYCVPQITRITSIETIKAPTLNTMIYPNPTNDRITIDLAENVKSATVNLMDLTGRKLIEQHITDGYRANMDVSPLNPGIYFIEVTSGGRKAVEKIVKN
jgi:hypothetical protein